MHRNRDEAGFAHIDLHSEHFDSPADARDQQRFESTKVEQIKCPISSAISGNHHIKLISGRNIGQCAGGFCYQFSGIDRFESWTENPRVGGSIPSLAHQSIKGPYRAHWERFIPGT